jgi:hypothetical protein
MKLLRLIPPLLLVSACTGDPAGLGSGDARLTVSVDATLPEPEHNVVVEVENRSDETLYVYRDCGNIAAWGIERRVAGGWVDDPYPILCAAYTPPVELAPGESTRSSVPIHEPGRYRTTVRVTTELETGDIAEVREEFTVGS